MGEWDYWHEVVAPLVGPDDEVLEQPPEAVKLDLMAAAVADVGALAPAARTASLVRAS